MALSDSFLQFGFLKLNLLETEIEYFYPHLIKVFKRSILIRESEILNVLATPRIQSIFKEAVIKLFKKEIFNIYVNKTVFCFQSAKKCCTDIIARLEKTAKAVVGSSQNCIKCRA